MQALDELPILQGLLCGLVNYGLDKRFCRVERVVVLCQLGILGDDMQSAHPEVVLLRCRTDWCGHCGCWHAGSGHD